MAIYLLGRKHFSPLRGVGRTKRILNNLSIARACAHPNELRCDLEVFLMLRPDIILFGRVTSDVITGATVQNDCAN